MHFVVVVNMKNPNALIAMAQVAQNANNPYAAFCEYIKYCIFSNVSDMMTLSEIRTAVGKEFGLYMPHNILMKCLSHVQDEGVIIFDTHQIKRVGSFDTEAFDRDRESYRATESAVIQAMMQYASKYKREWTEEYTRGLLIKVLDRNGLAYDIFLHEGSFTNGGHQPVIGEDEVTEMLPDDEAIEPDDIATQPLFTDEYFVGKFIEETLAGDTVQKDYLIKICEGLMLCVGTYQLPSTDTSGCAPQINGTKFFFDTKLLLRFLGCASEAAVSAAKELVALIQNAGGRIYYYPQTLQEMERALENAAKSLSYGYPPADDEMRLFAMSIQNKPAIITAKKATLTRELAHVNIHLAPHETFTDKERIRFGFDQHDLQQYMRSNLPWDPQVIDNDALAIWETHMRRKGNYSEYCGTGAQLPVFVTTNSRLIGVALKFSEDRSGMPSLYNWKQNRLPVITDIRLTCRLWSPSENSERMSLLYLTANAVAAKRPTKRYLNSIREFAIQLGEQAPEYSEICLPAYFDDMVTDAILKHTMGEDDKLDINSFATSIAELFEWQAKEQKEITNQVVAERDEKIIELDQLTESIIRGAVDSNKNRLGYVGVILRAILWWPAIVALLFAGISSVLSWAIGNWNVAWITLLPIIAKGLEMLFASKIIEKIMLTWYMPKAKVNFEKRIERNLRPAEQPYKEIIIWKAKEETSLWKKCQSLVKVE